MRSRSPGIWSPSIEIRPASGRRMPPAQRRVVDLPAPFWPSSTSSCPCSTLRSTPSTARTSSKLFSRPSTWITGSPSLDLLERLHGQYEHRGAADLDLHRVGHEELSRLHHRGHRRQVAAALAAVGADGLQHLGHPLVVDPDQQRGVALLQEAARGGDPGHADAGRGQRLDGPGGVLALDDGDYELRGVAPFSSSLTRSRTSACSSPAGNRAFSRTKRCGSAAASRSYSAVTRRWNSGDSASRRSAFLPALEWRSSPASAGSSSRKVRSGRGKLSGQYVGAPRPPPW